MKTCKKAKIEKKKPYKHLVSCPMVSDWVVTDYAAYLKRQKKKDSRERFNQFLAKKLKERGVDVSLVSSGLVLFQSLFRESYQLRAFIADIVILQEELSVRLKNLEKTH